MRDAPSVGGPAHDARRIAHDDWIHHGDTESTERRPGHEPRITISATEHTESTEKAVRISIPLCLCSCVPSFLCAFVPLLLCSFVLMCLCSFAPLHLSSYAPVFLRAYAASRRCRSRFLTQGRGERWEERATRHGPGIPDTDVSHRELNAACGRNRKNYTTKSTKDTKVGIEGAIQREFFSFFVVFATFVVSSLKRSCQEDKM